MIIYCHQAIKRQTNKVAKRSIRVMPLLSVSKWQLPRGNHRNQARLRSEGGQSAIEFAFAVPILVAVVFGFMQLCMIFYTRNLISECAREGSRYAILHGATCKTSSGSSCEAAVSDIQSYITGNKLPNIGGGTMQIAVTYPDGNDQPNSRVTVTITYAYALKAPFIPSQFINLKSSSTMIILQ
jgi:Flp pilus assembly protein TadG